MEGVREVKRFDGNRLHWRCDRRTGDGMGFGDHRADPRYRITWKSSNSPVEDGTASFTTIYEGTRVTLQMTFDPAWLVVPADGGDPKSALVRRVEGSLQRFKEFIEGRSHETWRLAWRDPRRSGHPRVRSDQTDISRPDQFPDLNATESSTLGLNWMWTPPPTRSWRDGGRSDPLLSEGARPRTVSNRPSPSVSRAWNHDMPDIRPSAASATTSPRPEDLGCGGAPLRRHPP